MNTLENNFLQSLSHIFFYIATRAPSFFLTFYLFIYIYDAFSSEELIEIYLFWTCCIILISVLRLSNQYIIKSNGRKNIGSFVNAYRFLTYVLILSAPIFFFIFFLGNIWHTLVLFLVVFFVAFDVDIWRAVKNKKQYASLEFSLGTLFCLLLIAQQNELTVYEAKYIAAFQFLFTAFRNLYFLISQSIFFQIFKFPVIKTNSIAFNEISIATCEVLIINLPIILSLGQGESKISLVEINRLFSTSVFFLPIIFHLKNNGSIDKISDYIKISANKLYFFVLSASGFAVLLVSYFFWLFTGDNIPSLFIFFLALMLLVNYAYFSSNMRNKTIYSLEKFSGIKSLLLISIIFYLLSLVSIFNDLIFLIVVLFGQAISMHMLNAFLKRDS